MHEEIDLENRMSVFISQVRWLCLEYDVNISHEDKEGSFILEEGFDEEKFKWFESSLKRTCR
jgi:hypothetical protein